MKSPKQNSASASAAKDNTSAAKSKNNKAQVLESADSMDPENAGSENRWVPKRVKHGGDRRPTGRKPKAQIQREKLEAEAEAKRLETLMGLCMETQLPDPRHERFAALLARGYTHTEAYLGSHPRCNSHETARKYGKALTRDPEIQRRVKELIGVITTSDMLSMQERRQFLARVVRANSATLNIKTDGDLVQEYVIAQNSVKIRLPSKLEALMADAKLAGEVVEKVEHSGEMENRLVLTDERIDRIAQIRKESLEKMRGMLGIDRQG